MKFFDLLFAIKLLPIMLKYVRVTLALSIISMAIGLVLAFFISLTIHGKIPYLHKIMKVYVSFFRGTPLLAQLFLFYFGFAQVFPVFARISSFTAAFIIMGLNSSAYMAESIRAGIASVDKGQMEACLSVGMTYMQAMRRIILPQALKNSIPTLANTFINLIKESSLAFTIGVKEITASAQLEATSSFKYLEAYVDIILVYWLITSILGYFQKKIEVKLSESA